MAQASTRAATRPLSPHLTIWRWGPGMIASILHRVTGVGLTVGLGLLIWWLAALAAGPEAYGRFAGWVWADLGALEWSGFGAIVGSLARIVLKVVVIGVSWSFFAHTVTGIRHFVLDAGAGYELDANNRWAWIGIGLGFLLTAAFWALLLYR